MPQQAAVRAALEQARQHRVTQQLLAPALVQRQDRLREALEHVLDERRLESRDQARDLLDLVGERVGGVRGRSVLRQLHQHCRQRGWVFDEQHEIEERGFAESGRRVHAHPALVGRIEVDGSAAGNGVLLARPLMLDERQAVWTGHAELEDLGARRRRRVDVLDAVLHQDVGQRIEDGLAVVAAQRAPGRSG